MTTIKHIMTAGGALALVALFTMGGCKKSDSGSTDADPAPQPAVTTQGTQATPMTGSSGSNCSPEGAYGCSPDGIHEVHCVGAKWQQFRTCKGPLHCSHVGSNTKCDYGALMPGDVCAPPLNSMCTADHKGVLTCAGGRLAVTQTCTGSQVCKPGVGCK